MLEIYQGIRREDFYIRPMVQRVWAVQIDILHEIDIICKRHDIAWFGDWGTMLGAVRSGGYIPWDDDLDISMKRLDFERFKRYAMKELPEGFVCNLERNEGLKDLVFRIKNTDSINLSEEFLDKYHGCPYSVGVDIFVYDNIPDQPEERQAYVTVFTYTFAAAADISAEAIYDQIKGENKELIEEAERMTGVTLDHERPVRGQLIKLADQIAAMYYDTKCRDVAQTCYLPHNPDYAFRKEWFDSVIYLPFEQIQMPIPIGYEFILERWFGKDYMIPKRYCDHTYPYFKAQEERLFQYFRDKNEEIPEIFQH